MQGKHRSLWGGGRRACYVTLDLSYDLEGAGQEGQRTIPGWKRKWSLPQVHSLPARAVDALSIIRQRKGYVRHPAPSGILSLLANLRVSGFVGARLHEK